MWSGKRTLNRKLWKSGIVICLLCTGTLCFSVFADGPSSNVWLDVIEIPTEARISVTVPLSYGFAVVGSVESGDTGPVSTADGNLLLPNVRVAVSTPSGELPGAAGSGAVYSIQTVGEAVIPILNYSTDVREENMDLENPPREGLPVSLEPYMLEVTDTIVHHWKPSAAIPTVVDTDFKKFQMRLDGKAFSVPDTMLIGSVTKNILKLDGEIELDAPPNVLTLGYTAAGTANIPSEKYISVDVKIGGRQNQYKQVEQSLKVGEIRWKVIPGELPPVTP